MADEDEDQGAGDAGGPPRRRSSSPLGRQLGPFTVGAWGVIMVGGVGLGLLIRRSSLFSGGTLPEPGSDAAGDPIAAASSGYVPAGPLAGGGSSPVTSAASPLSPRSATDNLGWQRLVTDQLIAGGQDPTLVAAALTNFLNGYPVTRTQKAVINMALRLGSPPEGYPPITDADETPASTNPMAPASGSAGASSSTPQTPATVPQPVREATPAQIATLENAYGEVVAKLNSGNPGDITTLGNQAAWFNIRTGDDGPIAHTPEGDRNAYFLALRYRTMGRNDLITPRSG